MEKVPGVPSTKAKAHSKFPTILIYLQTFTFGSPTL
ncbi:uncharacterized protein G2W53_043025 [Senna tora]|uniref:Uncharacterized protein n=1 Tax=Senna tora TaxID=362788 RepID=A0A834W4G8_9FABA|nr:uncharacterized protein G2W53_043025 [Senna tora]